MHFRPSGLAATTFALAALALATACDESPVVWSDPMEIDGARGALSDDARLTVDSAGQPRLAAPAPAATLGPPAAPGRCASSLRTIQAAAHRFAAWWAVRPDSSAILYVASSTDSGRTWAAPVAADTADVSSRGCNRPPPAVATSGDDLHVAYSMTASEGTGVFFAHFMESMVHAPVAVIYGERLVATAIAAEGDRVVVAYEEPNGTRQQIDVALSSTQGHIFERHETASRAIDAATHPLVALAGHHLAVAWESRRAGDTASAWVGRAGVTR